MKRGGRGRQSSPWYENAGNPSRWMRRNLTAGWTENEAEGFDGRPLMSVHRARVWFRGNAHKRLKYVAHLAFDRIGADQYALLQGKPFSASRAPAVQDAFAQWDVYGSGALRLTGGWMRPQIGRGWCCCRLESGAGIDRRSGSDCNRWGRPRTTTGLNLAGESPR